jgi:DNA-3-methyladenine glycosylase
MARILRPAEVHDRDTVAIARHLIGKWLVTRQPDGTRFARRIIEAEAYNGPDDLACHASRGRTKRTAVMFEPGGVWYVYLVYGMHEMLNLVTGPRDYPAAVLIRGVAGVVGPGRVTRAFGIDRRYNGTPCSRASGLWIEDDGFTPRDADVRATPRIGIDYAGAPWVAKPWRFVWTPANASDDRNDGNVARGRKQRQRANDG